MILRKAKKSDLEILTNMLNYNPFDDATQSISFKEIFLSLYNDFYIILYKNIRIGIIYKKDIFINPLYWERIEYHEIETLMENLK